MSLDLEQILLTFQQGERSLKETKEALSTMPVPAGQALLDLGRELKTGTPEIIYGQHKSLAQLLAITKALTEANRLAIITRVSPQSAKEICNAFTNSHYDDVANCVTVGQLPKVKSLGVELLCAGTSDYPVAKETQVVLNALGVECTPIMDVGVACIQRVLAKQEELAVARVVIVIAGMEGALPSVVAGLTKAPVIAVPTSVGYGVSQQGFVALASMLSSCSPGIATVNIDNGVGAAMLAYRMVTNDR